MDHAYYNALLGSRESRKIKNNTYAQQRENGDIAIKLHATDVVTFHADGLVTYRTGGYATVTTKDRLNNCGHHSVRVYSDKGEWMLYSYSHSTGLSAVAPFVDGMTFDPDDLAGSTAQYRSIADDAHIANAKMKRAIDKFVRSLTDDRLSEIVESARRPMGLLGNCLICRIELGGIEQDGRLFFGLVKAHDTSHLLSHLEEDYHHATLLMCALVWAGYRSPAAVIGWGDIVRRTLKRYLKARLITQGSALVTATR